MPAAPEPPDASELPLPIQPDAAVLAPSLRPAGHRRELRRLEAERERAQRALGALVVEILGAVAGTWIERSKSDPAATPVTVPTIITETVTQPSPAAPAAVRVTTTSALTPHGGHAVARAR